MVDDKQSCSPENLRGVAEELRKLADQIESAKVTVGGVTLAICNAVSLKIKQKLTGGKVKFDMAVTVSLADQEDSSSPAVSPEKAPATKRPVKAKSSTAKPEKKTRPYEVKKLKKTMTQQWKELSTAIKAGQLPDAILAKEFLAICEEYGQRAEEEWKPLWQESVESMRELLRHAEQGDFQEASRLVTVVNNQKKSCHKKYK